MLNDAVSVVVHVDVYPIPMEKFPLEIDTAASVLGVVQLAIAAMIASESEVL
jgi:hypothetical protein